MKDIAHQNYIGEQICKLRKSKGWTQYTLGKKLCKKTSTISAYETNAKLPSAEGLIEMAELFGVSIDTLVYGERADVISVHALSKDKKEVVSAIVQALSTDNAQPSDVKQRLHLVSKIAFLLGQ